MRAPSYGLSRRGLLAGAGACGLLPFGLEAQEVAPEPATDLAGDMAARSEAGRRLTIDVRVAGKGPFRFIVDTGAERTVVADSVLTGLSLVKGDAVTVEGLALRMPAETVTVSELAFGPFVHRDLRVPVLSRQLLGCDGYLGLDVIAKRRVTFDFAHHVVRIDTERERYGSYDPRHLTTSVGLSGHDGRLRTTECAVDGVWTTAFIDTGAEISVGNPALHAALMKRKVPPVDLGEVVITGVTGGQATGRLIPVRGIHMQALNFTNGTLAIADVPNFAGWGLDRQPALLIGMDFLRQFGRVSIDYRQREVRFELSNALDGQAPAGVIARQGAGGSLAG